MVYGVQLEWIGPQSCRGLGFSIAPSYVIDEFTSTSANHIGHIPSHIGQGWMPATLSWAPTTIIDGENAMHYIIACTFIF